MGTNIFTVIDNDPGASLTTPVRSLGGIVKVGVVTVSNTPVYYPEYARWLYVPVTGNVTYITWGGDTVTLTNLLAGIWHPFFSIAVTAYTAGGTLLWGS